ncbi:MAG: hypothetical protein K9I94_14570 [Bacteroidales bacterium]|nr:hypothetical protein [Bacteroidales bacterium]
MMSRFIKPFILVILSGLIFSACDKNDDSTPPVAIVFKFNHQVDGNDIEFDTIKYTNQAGNKYSVVRLKYFISDISLQKENGKEVFIDTIHYVDARSEGTLIFSPETTIEQGNYTSISFIYGISEEKNKRGRFPNPPENNMEWPFAMGAEYGYHYMKLEGKHDSAGNIKNYQAHTGPTNENQNYINVSLPNSGFTADNDPVTINLVMNINRWWKNPHTLDLNNISGIMGNQEIQEKLKTNGANVFSMGTVE